jgi:hypothetical protein
MKKCVWALTLALLFVGSAFADELIVNGGFESGVLDPWFNARNFCSNNCQPWAVTNANPHSGSFSAMDVGNIELRQDITPTLGSQITSATFWVNNSVGVDAVDFFYDDNSDEEFVVFTNPGTWNLADVTADINPSKTLVAFSIFGCDPACTTFVDDVSITTGAGVPEPGTLVMLGSGVLAAAGALRRKFNA